jgi:hypothetical protein
MALSLKQVANTSVTGNRRVKYFDVTFDSSYATGGLSLKPGDFGMSRIDALDANPVGGRSFPYDYTNQKLQAYGGTTEVTAATNLSTVTTRVQVEGI